MDVVSAWANVGALLLVGGVVSLVLVLLAATADGAPTTPPARRGVARGIGVGGALTALACGVGVAAAAGFGPRYWWLAPAGWVVWIVGEVLTFLLVAALFAVDRRLTRR